MSTLRQRARRKPRVAFVLSGGGNLGAIQVGMLRALTERNIVADVVLGCSVGALNGSAYAANPTIAGIRRLESVWRNLDSGPASVMPASRLPNPVQLIRKGESLHRNDGLRSTIESFLDDRRAFSELELPFQCVATDVDALVEHWFTEGDLVDSVLASAALPSVYPMVHLDGHRYLDGGVVNNVPIGRATHLGARVVYVLHCGLHSRPQTEIRRPIDAALLAYWISRNSRFARDIATLPPSVHAIVLPPGDRPEVRFDDFSQTNELMTQGYLKTCEHLDALDAAANEERPRGERTVRPDVRKVAARFTDRAGSRGAAPSVPEPSVAGTEPPRSDAGDITG